MSINGICIEENVLFLDVDKDPMFLMAISLVKPPQHT